MTFLGFSCDKPTRIALTVDDVHRVYSITPPPPPVEQPVRGSRSVPILIDLSQTNRGPQIFTNGTEPTPFNLLPLREQTRLNWVNFVLTVNAMRGHDSVREVLRIAHQFTAEAQCPVAIRFVNGMVVLASDFGEEELVARFAGANQGR